MAATPVAAAAGGPIIRLLGSFQVERSGTLVDCGGLKQRAIVALLALSANRPVSTERVIDDLWGGQPPPTAVATLQAYVSNLRKALEPDRPARSAASLLVSRSGAYELVVEADQVDVLRFERLVADGARCLTEQPARARELLAEALGLWRGPALVELEGFEFASREITRLDELRITARETRVAADLAVGHGPHLIAELESLVAEHPLRERLWAHLMKAYYRAGRQAEALRAYRRCERVLGDELGLAPSTELRSLERAVLDQDPGLLVTEPPSVEPGPPAGAGPTGRSTMVGRAAELRAFDEALHRAELGQGSVLLVRGEPGVGKTRLIEAMRQRSVDLGCWAALARCVEVGGSPPYWPWIQIARALAADEVTNAAGPYSPFPTPSLLQPGPDAIGEPTGGPQHYRVADGLVEAMRRLGASRPLVVLIDDLYCADPDSLSVLALIGAAVADEPVVVVGTHRPSGPRDQHLVDMLVQLSRFDWCSRLHLSRLGHQQVGELVRLVAGPDVDRDAVEAIHARTEGNAFFTVELAKLLLDDQGTTDLAPIPDTVKEVVARRLNALSAPALTLIRVAALTGRSFDLSVVAEAADAPMWLALELVEAAVAEGIVEEIDLAGHYRFSHVLTLDAIAAGLGALRRAQLHDRLAIVLEHRFGQDGEPWHDIAHHRVEAIPITGPQPAIEALARAGRRATAANALALADQLLTKRLALVMGARPSPERDRAELEALLDQSVVWTWRDGYQSDRMRLAADRMAELTRAAVPDTILDPSSETGTRYGVLPALQARCSFEIVGGNVDASDRIARTMLELAELTAHPYVVAVANINAMVAALHAGRVGDALAHGARTAEVLPAVDPGPSGEITLPLGQQSLAVTHLGFSGWAERMSGQRDLAQETLLRGRIVADRCQHAFSRAFHASIECIVATIDRSPAWVTEVLQWEGHDGDQERFGFLDASLSVYRTWAAGMVGDPVTAASTLRRGLAELECQGACVVQTLHWAMVAELELRGSRPSDALRAVETGLARSTVFGERFWRPELERLGAVALGELGDPDGRDAALARASRVATEMGSTAFERRPSAVAPR